jgi:CysZ protein
VSGAPDGPPFKAFRAGFGVPWLGARWIVAHQEAWPLVAAPAALHAVLGAAVLWLCFVVVPAWFRSALPAPEGASYLLWLIPYLLLIAAVLVAGLVVVYVVGGLLLLPFVDLLSRQVERVEVGGAPDDDGWRDVARDLLQSVAHSLLAAGLWLVGNLLLMLLYAVPVLGELLHMAGGAMLSALLIARELIDAPLSRRRLGFWAKLAVLRRHLWYWWGAGAVTGLLLFVPFLNLVVLPAAVAGATLVHLRHESGQAKG